MGIFELFLLAVGLSMDAFAVSVCKGLSTQRLRAQHCVICGLYFGGFQGLMPLVGWLLGGSSAIWSRIVFTVVGVAAVCGIPGLFAEETEE